MLHTKSQGHWPFGSAEDVEGFFFIIYGRAVNFDYVAYMRWKKLLLPLLTDPPYKIWLRFAQWFLRRCEKSDRWTTDGRPSLSIL